jgi:hypothetical protein
MIRQIGLTNILGQSLWETNIYPASQAISLLLWKPKFNYCKKYGMLCGSDRVRRFGGKYSHHLQDRRIRTERNQQQQATSRAGEMSK